MVPGSVKHLARIARAFEQYSVAGSQIAAKPCKKKSGIMLSNLRCADKRKAVVGVPWMLEASWVSGPWL